MATSGPSFGAGRAAAFLDRDGTLNVNPPEHRYVESLEGFAWLAGAIDGAVVSNQRGIARGLVSADTLGEIELEIQSRLREHGAEIAAFRYCPHERDAGCDCRKPAPGMLLELARTLELDLARCWMIGDADTDVAAGRAAGCRTALIDAAGANGDAAADVVAGSLAQVAEAIVGREGAAELSPA